MNAACAHKTILVTGGAGFIGANFVMNWLSRGQGKVINLDKLTYAGNPKTLAPLADNPDHIFVHGDIGDRELVAQLFADHRPTAIVNFAAESHVDRSIHDPEEFMQTNIIGTYRLLDEARSYWNTLPPEDRDTFRFLHVSTDEVFGTLSPSDPAFTETTAYQPNSPYSASKAASDHLVRSYFHTYGLPVLTTNCSNNYGPYQFPEKLIPLIIHNCLAGKPLPIYGDGQQIRDWLYVSDHCDAVAHVLDRGILGQVYNIGGWNEKTNLQVVTQICQILDRLRPPIPEHQIASYEDLITFVTDRPGHDRRYAIDATKIKDTLGWTPAESFETGIEKTINWYLNNQDWVQNITSGTYQDWIESQYS